MTKLQVCVKQVYLQALFQTLQINFEKLLGKRVFKNNHCNLLRGFKICPPYLLLYLPRVLSIHACYPSTCYPYTRVILARVIHTFF